jgi:hypothetical protein
MVGGCSSTRSTGKINAKPENFERRERQGSVKKGQKEKKKANKKGTANSARPV